ncbi:MAG: 3-dehydroquinate synthase [Gammaproteobacteria bacterium]
MRKVTVNLGERSYPVLIGSGLLSSNVIAEMIEAGQVLIVSNSTVAPLYLSQVQDSLRQHRTRSLVLPDGESFKTLEVMKDIVTELLRHRFGRDAFLIALGGGVIGDLTGFAAACFQRGIRYLQVPTTLLAQVDASVGGKTAVNHELGKNMIGAFHQPIGVVADTDTLKTLPSRELRAGLAEIIKYGLIRDGEFFDWLEKNMDALLARDNAALEHSIERSCRNKAAVVALDERESGLRATLNLGHTFGHAIETGLGYSGWLHGEAVAVGMLMAADLSRRLGWLNADAMDRLRDLLRRAGLPERAPAGLSSARLLDIMAVDKKSTSGRLRLVLLKSIGAAVLTDDFDLSLLEETLAAFTGA